MNVKNPSAYLAGPDVFFPDPINRGKQMKQILSSHGILGHFPLDNTISLELTAAEAADAIFQANARMLGKSDLVLANITPFRGPSLDPGTAWEIGYAYALGIPIICYGTSGTYLERCQKLGIEGDSVGLDDKGILIEDFGEVENLMISRCAKLIVGTFEEAAVCALKLIASRT